MESPRPVVHCLAAYVKEDGEVWGTIHRVSLEAAEWLQQIGYAIIGPDPSDMCDLATWERDHRHA